MADMDMIYDLVKETRTDVSEIKRDMKLGAIEMENHNVRLGHIETDIKDLKTGQKKIKTDLWNHINSKKKHYNQGYTESFSQRTWRRKDLIALLTTISTIIAITIKYTWGG